MNQSSDDQEPAPEISLLLGALDEAYEAAAWHGPNLLGSIRRVGAAEAACWQSRSRTCWYTWVAGMMFLSHGKCVLKEHKEHHASFVFSFVLPGLLCLGYFAWATCPPLNPAKRGGKGVGPV